VVLITAIEVADEVGGCSCLMVLAKALSRMDPLLANLALFTDPGEPGDDGLMEASDGGCC
jgi:hypothetical protein